MKAYSVYFKGRWPVGACAVIFAPNVLMARMLFEEKLSRNNLEFTGKEIIEELGMDVPSCYILLDGEY